MKLVKCVRFSYFDVEKNDKVLGGNLIFVI